MTEVTPVLEMRGITKRYPGVLANDAIDLDLRPGEIHALLGENGAGKSTLMNILYGLAVPDAGTILINGQEVDILGPTDAIARWISMVHQHFMLVPVLTVAENIVLGEETMANPIFIDEKAASRKIKAFGEQFGFTRMQAVDDSGQRRQPLRDQRRRVPGPEEALGPGEQVVVVSVPTEPGPGTECLGHQLVGLGSAVTTWKPPVMNAGEVSSVSATACWAQGPTVGAVGIGPVADVPGRRLAGQPLPDVAFHRAGRVGELARRCWARDREAPGRDRVDRRSPRARR